MFLCPNSPKYILNWISRVDDRHSRAVARCENPRGLVVLGGDNVSPLVEIGLAALPNIGGAKAPPAPTLRRPCYMHDYSICKLIPINLHIPELSLGVQI